MSLPHRAPLSTIAGTFGEAALAISSLRPAITKPGDAATSVAEAIRSRHSVRHFLPTPVAPATVREILEIASHTPSGSNLQPWTVFVLTGRTLASLGSDMRAAYLADEPGHVRDYKYYPAELPEPFLSRRRACGWSLYNTLGIVKGDKPRMKAQRSTNYDFFLAHRWAWCSPSTQRLRSAAGSITAASCRA